MIDFKHHAGVSLDHLANVSAVWRLPNAATSNLSGLFTDPAEEINLGNQLGVMAAQPVLRVKTADLPAGAANGDVVTIDGAEYEADGLDTHKIVGITRVLLIKR